MSRGVAASSHLTVQAVMVVVAMATGSEGFAASVRLAVVVMPMGLDTMHHCTTDLRMPTPRLTLASLSSPPHTPSLSFGLPLRPTG